MKEYIGKLFKRQHENVYFLFRIVFGFLFFMHGAYKLFGWFGAQGSANLYSIFWFAGLTETLAGAAIVLGLLTRLAALLSVIEMAVAYFMIHTPGGFNPLANGGELAILYLFAFLVMTVYGAGKLSLEKYFFKKEFF